VDHACFHFEYAVDRPPDLCPGCLGTITTGE
jgi:hypothetical protein